MSGNHNNQKDSDRSRDQRDRLRAQAEDWLVRLTSGNATVADARAFKVWRLQSDAHAQAMDATSRLWEASRPAAQAVAYRDEREAKAVAASRSTKWSGGRRAFLGGALTAGVAAYVVVQPPAKLWPALSDMTADYRTGTGEQRQVALGDGLTVAMNTQTSFNARSMDALQGTPGATGQFAIDLLDGEAQLILSPAAGRVSVQAGSGKILAAGTAQFNVRVMDAQVCVTCLSGSVRVDLAGGGRVLGANQQAIYDADRAEVSDVHDVAVVTAWRDQVLVFNDVSLSAAVREINRYRPGRIILTSSELGQRRVQARLRMDQLADVAQLLQANYGAKVRTLPAGVILLG